MNDFFGPLYREHTIINVFREAKGPFSYEKLSRLIFEFHYIFTYTHVNIKWTAMIMEHLILPFLLLKRERQVH